MNTAPDRQQVRAFCVLARTGTITQTAHELDLTPSSVSQLIKALETTIGCRLLCKLGKKVVPTQAGEQFLQHVKKILPEMENALTALGHLGKRGQGCLRLGMSTAAWQPLLPTVLQEFKKSFPDYAITIERGDAADLETRLLSHSIDLAMCLEPGKDPQLHAHHLFTDELEFVVGATHAWARAQRVDRLEIPRMTYIHNSVALGLVQDYFRQEKMALNSVIEMGSMEATKEMVKQGLGVSIMARWMARQEIEEGSLVALPLGRRKLKRRCGIVQWRGKRLNLAEETFIGLCKIRLRLASA
jgi:hypothetical protein